MNKTHTPGPWLARDYKNDDDDIWIDCDSWVNPKTASCRGGTLATVHASGTGQGSVEANARLIAAAPELLAALEAIVATYRTFRNVPKAEQEWTSLDDEAIKAGFAAIEKAKTHPSPIAPR